MFIKAYSSDRQTGQRFERYINLLTVSSIMEPIKNGSLTPSGARSALCIPGGHYFFSDLSPEEIVQTYDLIALPSSN